DPVKGPTPWTSLDLNNNPDHFQFVIVSDRTGGRRPGIFPEAVEKINLLQPQFVICVGDLIDGYTENKQKIDAQWDEFADIVSQLQMPYFHVPGNHDLSNDKQAAAWKKRLGPSYYHFRYRDVLFLCLNSEDGKQNNI